jgi:signal transduction histidine kinase
MPSTKTAGMGFGLAISRSLIEANGGRIRLVSSGASGTIIAFTVPVDDGTAERASA